MLRQGLAQRWAQVSGLPRAEGQGKGGWWWWGGASGFTALQNLLSVGLLRPPACLVCPRWAGVGLLPAIPPPTAPVPTSSVSGVKAKKPIQTKFRMPLLNWVALKPNQITGTVFTELNDEKVLQVSVALLCCQCGH